MIMAASYISTLGSEDPSTQFSSLPRGLLKGRKEGLLEVSRGGLGGSLGVEAWMYI